MEPRPASLAPAASARNSRQREKAMTIIEANSPNTSCSTITETKYPMPPPPSRSRPPDSQLSTSRPTTRAATITSVFSTPWIRVSVTMSPLATWPIS